MKWTEKQIKYVIQDMIEENPLASRALLEITDIEFTGAVPTMAVTLSAKPMLKINLRFCDEHLKTENDVKAVLLHEFLHILLLHTEKYTISSPLLNIALDAIINSIIYRYKGMEYADFFKRFYHKNNIGVLLRQLNLFERLDDEWEQIHRKIYSGKYCADDLFELLSYLENKILDEEIKEILLLGNHDDNNQIPKEIKEILDQTMKKMDGALIWNKPKTRGTGESKRTDAQDIVKYRKNKWENSTFRLIQKSLIRDKKSKSETVTREMILPILSSHDSRALARYQFSGIIPLSKTEYLKTTESQRVSIYLDVSGSMNGEIQSIVSLLYHFRALIKMPLWVFSNEVEEARIKNGKLEYKSSGGTSISPVFDHLRKHKTEKCMIVTDGYVEKIDEVMLYGLRKDKINVLVSAEGNPSVFENAGIPYLQLEKL